MIGYVYVIGEATGRFYKIGRSADANLRIWSLRSHSPFKLLPSPIMLWKSQDTVAFERSLHQKFASKRTNGEWFELAQADLQILRAIGGDIRPEGVIEKLCSMNVRGVPDWLISAAKEKARAQGLPLRTYILNLLKEDCAPTSPKESTLSETAPTASGNVIFLPSSSENKGK